MYVCNLHSSNTRIHSIHRVYNIGIARPANILQESGITYITNKECEQRYGQSAVDDSMLCALEDNKGACQGDSGGPLLVTGASGDPNDDVQVGIVSWGKDCALKDWPGT